MSFRRLNICSPLGGETNTFNPRNLYLKYTLDQSNSQEQERIMLIMNYLKITGTK